MTTAAETPENDVRGVWMYEGDLADAATLAPFAAAAGIGLGLDWLLLLAVIGVVIGAIVYRWLGRRARRS